MVHHLRLEPQNNMPSFRSAIDWTTKAGYPASTLIGAVLRAPTPTILPVARHIISRIGAAPHTMPMVNDASTGIYVYPGDRRFLFRLSITFVRVGVFGIQTCFSIPGAATVSSEACAFMRHTGIIRLTVAKAVTMVLERW